MAEEDKILKELQQINKKLDKIAGNINRVADAIRASGQASLKDTYGVK